MDAIVQLLGKTIFLASHLAGQAFLEATATIAVITSGIPQLWTLLRGGDGRGVSVPTWIVVFVSGLLWGAYGLGAHDPWIIGTNVFVALNGAAVSGLTIARRRARTLSPVDANASTDDAAA
jgi:hypothetical protein